jgi:hypothetical protein
MWSLLGGALTELAKSKSGGSTPTGSSTYDHFSSLLQRIANKQLEVNTQRGYVALVDEMATHSMMLPNPQMSTLVKELRKTSVREHKTLKKMVSY